MTRSRKKKEESTVVVTRINCNPNCPNIHCEGGVITYDGQNGRLCRKCNPRK